MLRMKLYRKQGCWLCDAAEDMINGVKERMDARVDIVDIDSDEELYELYRFDIPVIEFPLTGATLHGRIKKKEFLRLCEDCSNFCPHHESLHDC